MRVSVFPPSITDLFPQRLHCTWLGLPPFAWSCLMHFRQRVWPHLGRILGMFPPALNRDWHPPSH